MYSDCERVRQWISVELDEELSEFEHALLASHLLACPACEAFRSAASRVSHELRAAPLESFSVPPLHLRRPRRRVSLRVAPAAAVLAVAAVGLGSILTSAQLRNVTGAGSRPAPASEIDTLTNLVRQSTREGRLATPRVQRRLPNTERLRGGPLLRP